MGNDSDKLSGCLLGLAVGDAIGLPREGLSPRRARRIFGHSPRMCLLPGIGMVSDDTDHAEMTARALLECGGDAGRFSRVLAWKLRWWLLALPAGVGFATLRSILKLWIGFPPSRSGVRSAGNGPCMRTPVIGVFFAGEPELRRAFADASTRLTHVDPRAILGARIVAEASALAATIRDPGKLRESVLAAVASLCADDSEGRDWLNALESSLRESWSGEQFAEAIGCRSGVSGYVHRTVPAALWAWLASPADFRGCMSRVVALGGDTDTVGAIAGALCGTFAGEAGIPSEWLAGLRDFPRSTEWLRRVADAATARRPCPAPRMAFAFPRNLVFLVIVLLHGLRRLLPPY